MAIRLDTPSRVYTMPSGAPFLHELARGLSAHLGDELSRALILLPTRRAVRALGDAFVESGAAGARATLLPRMRPLADIDSEDVGFGDADFEAASVEAGLVPDTPPAISPMQRRFEIARVVSLYHRRISDIPVTTAAALALADPLCAILDDAEMEEASLPDHGKLEEIRELAARHFQHASVFYEILQTFWPERLRELGLVDPKARQVAMLDALRARWEASPPDHPVIVAGSTGTLGATARLIRTVSRLPRGLVVLPGVDMNLRDSAWDQIDVQHPQNSLRRLLARLEVPRGDVATWPISERYDEGQMRARRKIVSEALVPIAAAETWPDRIATMRGEGVDFAAAVEGLSLIEARHDEEEALCIALILREALEDPDATAALVTPDSGLARRVRTRLLRWGVEADFSQGVPLEETALGAWLAGLAKLATDTTSAVDLAYVCKHGLTGLGWEESRSRRDWMANERLFRGRRVSDDERAGVACVRELVERLGPLTDIETARPDGWARALARAAEAVADTDAAPGATRLWAGEAGEVAAGLIEDLISHGDLVPAMTGAEFHDLLLGLMRERVVRTSRGTHPRLLILGPLEARMISADTLVLGGLNEGTWPQLPSAAPFLSREMRRALGLSLPERRFGLAAHDFAQSAAHRRVVLTRSERTGEGPAVASRWVWRLKTLMRGALGDGWEAALAPDRPYLDWARAMDAHHGAPEPATQPAPAPPPDMRWPKGRRLSITEIKTWVRDPYSIYCKHVLGLKPLDALDVAIGAPEYGSAIHKGIETFYRRFPDAAPAHAADELSLMLEVALLEQGFPATDMAKERPRLRRLADKLVAWIRARREAGWSFASSEDWGDVRLPDVDFEVYGRADLIETGPDGYAVIDFKTGKPPTAKQVGAGFDPQLPLTALMLSEGRVGELRAGKTGDLLYGVVRGYSDEGVPSSLTDKTPAADYMADTRDMLVRLVRRFDEADAAYYSQPRAQYTYDYGDYDDLARRGEWARAGDDPREGGGA